MATFGSLQGVRVASFYPWFPFEPSGAWNRFTSLWRYLHGEGASVTMAFLQKGRDVQLKDLAVRYLGEYTVVDNMHVIARIIASSPTMTEMRQYGDDERAFLFRYEKSLYLQTPRLASWLDDIVSSHDVITCEYPLYAPLLSDFCKKWRKPLVVTSYDALYSLHGSHPRAKEILKRKEIEAMQLADALVFVNEAEQKSFAQFGLKGITILNTSDVLRVTPGNEKKSHDFVHEQLQLPTRHYCLFVGSNHRPNAEAVLELRKLAARMPNITFVIGGTCTPPMRENNFVALGRVPDPLLDALYRGACAIVIPLLRGTGTSIKTFEAFTYGKAVVATPAGVRGFPVVDRKQAMIAAPAEMPAAIQRLIDDPELRARMGQAAREYALTLDYRSHFKPYTAIMCGLLKRPQIVANRRARSLILVDNNLCDQIGHHFGYALSLKNQCTVAGTAFHALIKRKADEDVVGQLSAEPTFSQGIHEPHADNPFPPTWGSMRGSYDLMASAVEFTKELESGLSRTAAPDDCVFLPNATPRQILGLALLLMRHPIYHALSFVVMLRYSVYGVIGTLAERKIVKDMGAAASYQTALESLVMSDPTGVARLATDSDLLAKEFAEFTSRTIEVLPIPHTVHEDTSSGSEDVPIKAGSALRIVYLGDAREEKGFELLPAVVRACNRDPSLPAIEFVFQAFISSMHHRKMHDTIQALKALPGSNLKLVEKPLSTSAYQALLATADIVLLPYDAATYKSRTSGPFMEAICANKPVVVPKDSWMTAQLGDSKAGESFPSGDAAAIAGAVGKLAAAYPEAKAAADALGAKFRSFHNPQTFVQHLMRTP